MASGWQSILIKNMRLFSFEDIKINCLKPVRYIIYIGLF